MEKVTKRSRANDIAQYHICLFIVFAHLLRRFQHVRSFALIELLCCWFFSYWAL